MEGVRWQFADRPNQSRRWAEDGGYAATERPPVWFNLQFDLIIVRDCGKLQFGSVTSRHYYSQQIRKCNGSKGGKKGRNTIARHGSTLGGMLVVAVTCGVRVCGGDSSSCCS